MDVLRKLLCGLKNRPAWLIALALALLLLLLLLREWLWGLFLLYLGALVFLGLMGGVRLAQGILRKLCSKLGAVPKGSGSEGHPPSLGIDVPPHTYKRPDPMIYSQYYLMSKGIAVTWDNPDIQLFNIAGGAVPSHGLSPTTPYEICARIWNGSTDAPAINVLLLLELWRRHGSQLHRRDLRRRAGKGFAIATSGGTNDLDNTTRRALLHPGGTQLD
jgi:hypothetical protein